ncbi:MAG: hypothetical protein SGILL_007085 [Bacillariaceae sp.]
MRGAFLKKLRELERQDDEERQRMASFMEEDEETATTNTLRYSTYLANQRGVYDDYKHVNYEFIEFDNNNQDAVPLTIQQDRKLGKGGFVWCAGYILADYLKKNPQLTLLQDKPQKVIELGSGTGVTGLLTAQAYPMAQVHLTDLPQLQPLLEGNVKLNSTLQNVTTGLVEWGSKSNETYDVILAADVVAGIYDGQALIKSLYDLAHDKTQIFLSCNEGRLAGIIDAFIGELKERFEVVERRQPHSDNRNPNIIVFVISGKREFQ